MTGVEKIKERILEEAQSQAKEVIKRAQDQSADIIEAAQKEADLKKKDILEKAELEAAELKKRLRAVAELEARKKKLWARQQVIQEAFDKATEKLEKLTDSEYEEIITNMLVASVKSKNEEVILSAKDKRRLSPDFIQKINKRLSSEKTKSNLTLSKEERNIGGGFILKSEDIETNNSFEALIKMQREKIESEVVKTLF